MKSNLILTFSFALFVISSTYPIPEIGETNSIQADSDYDLKDMELLPTIGIPEQLQVVSFFLNSKESSKIYELRTKNVEPGHNRDYVVLPIMNTDKETGKPVFEPYTIRITIRSSNPATLDTEADAMTAYSSSAPINSEQGPKENGEDIEENEINEIEPKPLEDKAASLEQEAKHEPGAIVTTPSRYSEEVRKPKVIVPRKGGDKSGQEHWTARFLSWFTLILYGTLMTTFLLFLVLNCFFANLMSIFNRGSGADMNNLNEVRTPIPSAAFANLYLSCKSKRRAYYESI